MNHSVPVRQEYLSRLIDRYKQFAADSSDRFLSEDLTPREMDKDFEGGAGYWWCRHMSRTALSGNGVFCIANVYVPEQIRGQGIFGEFLDYVISNPHHYTGVELESLDPDGRLIKYLVSERGFTVVREDGDGCPTARYMFVPLRQEYLSRLIDRYKQFAADSSDRFLSRDLTPREMYFEGGTGYWWCRHMRRDGVFCIANVTVPESIRGQGVFGEFLDYVISNPHHYTGVEVEAVFNDRLIEYLKERGFVDLRENSSGRPTLRLMFKE